MSYIDLLERIQERDTDAFLEMTDRYGWAVYSTICEKHSDKAVADSIYNETMNMFFRILSDSDAEDPLEALLCTLSGYISPDKLSFDRTATNHEQEPPRVELYPGSYSVKNNRRTHLNKRGFWNAFWIMLLLVVFASVIWFVAGVMMEMEYIPYYDLGYSWVEAKILQYF